MSAIALPSTASGSVVGSNLGATIEGGEAFTQGGKTVWYKWTAPVIGRTYRFGTRRRPDFGNGTSFPAGLAVFDSGGFSNFNLAVLGNRYANWWDQAEVTLGAQGNGQYYIRVGSLTGQGGPLNNGEGDFLLWWEESADIVPWPCGECVGIKSTLPGLDSELLACWTLDITHRNAQTLPLAVAKKGFYLVEYCGGAWNYRDGFVVNKVPPGATQQFGDNPGGHFVWVDGPQGWSDFTLFNDPVPPGLGFPTPEAAQSNARCAGIRFFHNGTAPVNLQFADLAYGDNSISSLGAPRYRIFRADPSSLKAGAAYCHRNGAGDYSATFYMTNTSAIDFIYMAGTLTGNPNIASSTVAGPGANNNGILAGQTVGITLFFTVAPATKLDLVTPLHMQVHPQFVADQPFIDLSYDLTPQVVVTPGAITKVAGKWKVDFTFASGNAANKPGLPTQNLHATFEQTGGVSDIRNANTDAAQTDFAVDDGFGNQTLAHLTFTPTPAGVGQVTFTIHLRDNDAGLDLPPVVFTLSCPP